MIIYLKIYKILCEPWFFKEIIHQIPSPFCLSLVNKIWPLIMDKCLFYNKKFLSRHKVNFLFCFLILLTTLEKLEITSFWTLGLFAILSSELHSFVQELHPLLWCCFEHLRIYWSWDEDKTKRGAKMGRGFFKLVIVFLLLFSMFVCFCFLFFQICLTELRWNISGEKKRLKSD